MSKVLKQINDLFKFQSQSKNYIIGISKDIENTHIIIAIALNNTDNITHKKSFTFEEFENFDIEFFSSFKKNFLLLYKFLIRLLLAKLIDIEISKENPDILYLNLICLKDNNLRPIRIDLQDIKEEKSLYFRREKSNGKDSNNNIENKEEYNIGSAPVPFNIKRKIKYKIDSKNETASNKKYKIELRKIENISNESEIYKEIEIKIINIKNKIIYYDYLDSQDIFDESIPYYNLFDLSIDDVYDDLNIIIYNGNYRFEVSKDSIKLFFQVFNVGEGGKDPYIEIFIQALDRERTEIELSMKMERFFHKPEEEELLKENKSQNGENGSNKELEINKNVLIKKKNKINYSQNFLSSFLNLNNNSKKEDENLINGSNNNNNIIIKNNIFNQEDKFNNQINDFNKDKNNNSIFDKKINFLNNKRYNDTTIEMFYKREMKDDLPNEYNKLNINNDNDFIKNGLSNKKEKDKNNKLKK